MQTVEYSREDVHRYLRGCAWPCSPTIVVQIARGNGAPPTLLEQLQALPDRIYMGERDLVDELARAGAMPSTEGTAAPVGDPRVKLGMTVVGSDQKQLGHVKEVRSGDFLLDRRLQRDLYVPYEAIAGVDAGRVVLNVPAVDVPYQRWPSPNTVQIRHTACGARPEFSTLEGPGHVIAGILADPGAACAASG